MKRFNRQPVPSQSAFERLPDDIRRFLLQSASTPIQTLPVKSRVQNTNNQFTFTSAASKSNPRYTRFILLSSSSMHLHDILKLFEQFGAIRDINSQQNKITIQFEKETEISNVPGFQILAKE
ncbi:Hypothetical_protein [Hexamita inflata]|uniref:Hypothetical_protein n=1 Tax=Hexamita inflata TaxID=28002 RepID=A0AA86PEN9_9EUKA|nr:Hypothetical protein HINF_LOCUS24296 [Hexamita inflata]CAI9943524.1 Hypothetical protein HINF_LOCUS31169 [Hexamita inflata]